MNRARSLLLVLSSLASIGLAPRTASAQLPPQMPSQMPSALARTGMFGDPAATMADLDRRIAEHVSRVEQLEAERARAEAEVSTLTGTRAETNRRLRDRTRALYRLTRAGALPLSGGLPSLLSHLARRERLERIVRADLEAMSDLRARTGALREESSRRAGELEQARASLRSLEEEKTRLEGSLYGGSGYGGGGYGGGGYGGGGYGAIVASGPTYGLQQSPIVSGSSYGLRVVEPGPSTTASFESQRGQLMLPLLSPTGLREAAREEGVGLEVAGAVGATVGAAADGRVAFSHTHAAYGRLVILDHGGSYFTIYGGLGRIDVTVGQSVARGAPIGTVDGAPLFFQVRRGTRALDPRAWLGL